MTWPNSIIIDTVFIPIYLILVVPALINIIKHGHGKQVGFIGLLIFGLVRVTGNLMIVIENNQNYSSINATIWGYILQSIGFSFLFASSLAFYNRSQAAKMSGENSGRRTRLTRILNLANIAALICIIVGQTSVSYVDAQGNMLNPKLPIEAKVGAIIYIVITVVLATLVLIGLTDMERDETRIILLALVVALPFLLVRAGYSTYAMFEGSVLQPKNIWVKFVFQYLTELAVVVIYTALGFLIPRARQPITETELDVEGVSNDHSHTAYEGETPPKFVPIQYVTPKQKS